MAETEIQIVDDKAGIKLLIDDLQGLPTSPPSLYLDLEGVNLSRHGSISILQLYILPKKQVYLIDIHTLKASAFDTASRGKTLRSVLQCQYTPKAFFDCRNDSDALFTHFGVTLKGIIDIQLLEVASREWWDSKNRLTGLGKLIQRDCNLSEEQRSKSSRIKDVGRRLFAPELGGSYEVFNERLLREEIIEYCAQDVTYLPELWIKYMTRIDVGWAHKVEVEAERRIEDS
ncbi:MAG: hypothetical protein L6R38_003803 [Xanthoria sp. 2 TBL-2021]|nr:MAG: hypothetical protein L6R38_003803 [Xanthoria sp. 2 TBL-2021]